jgi:hypothetical protein
VGLIDGQVKGQTGCYLGGCFAASVFIIFCVALAVGFLGGPSSSADQPTNNGVAAACGSQKWKAEKVPTADCKAGIMSRDISPNGFYHATFFGCSGGHTDPGDACNNGCPNLSSVNKTTGVVSLKGLHNRSYEDAIGYFSANSIQYGCGNKLKITNPYSGKAVIVVVIDGGPNCRVQGHQYTLDMSWLAEHTISAGNLVKVEKVPKSSAIGPVTSCTSLNNKSLQLALKNEKLETQLKQIQTEITGVSGQISTTEDLEGADQIILALLDSSQLPTVSSCQIG